MSLVIAASHLAHSAPPLAAIASLMSMYDRNSSPPLLPKPRTKFGSFTLPRSDCCALCAVACALALRGVNGQLEDKRFLGGFGSNGGEEFLSFMNISEALHARGGDDWRQWDRRVTPLVVGAQDKDGAWSGSHCITGRTACTSFALLTLMADRAPTSPGVKEPEKK